MSSIAWVVPGLAPGTLAKILIRGRGWPGFAVTIATGVTGALAGGWPASASLHGFPGLSISLTATATAAIAAQACCLVTSRASRPGHRTAWL